MTSAKSNHNGSLAMSILSKIPSESNGSVGEFVFQGECDFSTQFPGLFELVSRRKLEGKDRETGRILIYSDNGRATVCLMDRCTGQVAFFSAGTIGECLEGCERGIQSGSLDWRKDKRSGWKR